MDMCHGSRWWGSAARAIAIAAVVFSGLALLSAANTYRAQNGSQCGGGLGNLGPGYTIFFLSVCAVLLALGLAAFTIGSAAVNRRWAWVAGLFVTLAAGVIVVLGSSSTISHQAVGVVLGTGCSGYYSAVPVGAALVFVTVVELVYVLVGRRRPAANRPA